METRCLRSLGCPFSLDHFPDLGLPTLLDLKGEGLPKFLLRIYLTSLKDPMGNTGGIGHSYHLSVDVGDGGLFPFCWFRNL